MFCKTYQLSFLFNWQAATSFASQYKSFLNDFISALYILALEIMLVVKLLLRGDSAKSTAHISLEKNACGFFIFWIGKTKSFVLVVD